MNSPVQEIKDRLSIVDVVSGYIKLDRAGASVKAKCPFHNEKTASFFVSPDRGTYHCFGCNKGGDIFSFIEEVEGIPFKEALTILAQKAGVEIKKFQKTEKDDTRILEVLKEAESFFEDCLSKNEKVLLTIHFIRTNVFQESYDPKILMRLRRQLLLFASTLMPLHYLPNDRLRRHNVLIQLHCYHYHLKAIFLSTI